MRYNARDLLSRSASSVAKIAFSHLSRGIKKEERSRRPSDMLRVYYLSIIRDHPQSPCHSDPLSDLAAWDLSRFIFLCFCSPLRVYTCKGSRNAHSRQTMLAGSVQVGYPQIFVKDSDRLKGDRKYVGANRSNKKR